MSNLLTRRLAISMSLAALAATVLASPLSAQPSRWEYICRGESQTLYYLDIPTISRPSPDVVIFWWKASEPDKPDQKCHQTITRDRLTKIDGGDWSSIEPETILEAFYDRLFKLEKPLWEYIGKAKTGDYYLDISNVSRPSQDVVVFWMTVTKPDKPDYKFHATMTRDRLYKPDGQAWVNIPPEGVLKAVYDRLFK